MTCKSVQHSHPLRIFSLFVATFFTGTGIQLDSLGSKPRAADQPTAGAGRGSAGRNGIHVNDKWYRFRPKLGRTLEWRRTQHAFCRSGQADRNDPRSGHRKCEYRFRSCSHTGARRRHLSHCVLPYQYAGDIGFFKANRLWGCRGKHLYCHCRFQRRWETRPGCD